jgi:hypothetical protein
MRMPGQNYKKDRKIVFSTELENILLENARGKTQLWYNGNIIQNLIPLKVTHRDK